MKKKNCGSILIALGLLGLLGGCAGTDKQVENVIENSERMEAMESADHMEVTEALESNTYDSSLANTEEAFFSEDAAGELTVHYIDVGQGDATLIECNEQYMLIDAGNNDKGTMVQNYLVKQGVETLDYVIGTHPDADHIGGLDVAIYKFDCETIILPDVEKDTKTYEDVISAITTKGYEITTPVVGDTYSLGSAEFTIIAPNDTYTSNANDNSVGILLQNGENRFLFTGDAEEDAEADIVNNGINLSADVYKVAHHGSKTATTDAFFAEVNPSYAVISVGEDNAYGHPAAEVLNKLRASGVEVFRTDEQGTIVAISDGETITWNCSPSESWQAGEAKGSAKAENDTWGNAASEIAAESTGADRNATVSESTGADTSATVSESTGADTSTTVSESAGTDTTATITETPPAEITAVIVHITKTGSKYHSAGCQYLHSSDYEIELEQAKASGYTPCSKCNPPQ